MCLTIGAVIEESQSTNYFQKQPCAKAREMLILKWAIVGFLLTISYKSVLLSNLINIEYEEALDTVEDVLRSDKPLFLDTTSAVGNLLKSDPREGMKELSKKAKGFKTGVSQNGNAPLWLQKG